MSVGWWHGQGDEKAACLHLGAVVVTVAVTDEPVARYCPMCEGVQYIGGEATA